MRIAVLSDVHANLEAFKAVLADIDELRVRQIVCLGDTIGYGPDPEETVQLMRRRGIPSVMGNHEAGLVDDVARHWFNPQARRALELTGRLLSADSLGWLKSLPRFLVIAGARFVHGFPPDDVRTYLFEKSDDEILEELTRMEEAVCFVGHTHELEILSCSAGSLVRKTLAQGLFSISGNARSLVNVGSVGQPRDLDRRAKYVLYDPAAMAVEVRCVDYDAQSTAAKIIARGLPSVYASRLLS
jgi:predicted phosphodiesterase